MAKKIINIMEERAKSRMQLGVRFAPFLSGMLPWGDEWCWGYGTPLYFASGKQGIFKTYENGTREFDDNLLPFGEYAKSHMPVVQFLNEYLGITSECIESLIQYIGIREGKIWANAILAGYNEDLKNELLALYQPYFVSFPDVIEEYGDDIESRYELCQAIEMLNVENMPNESPSHIVEILESFNNDAFMEYLSEIAPKCFLDLFGRDVITILDKLDYDVSAFDPEDIETYKDAPLIVIIYTTFINELAYAAAVGVWDSVYMYMDSLRMDDVWSKAQSKKLPSLTVGIIKDETLAYIHDRLMNTNTKNNNKKRNKNKNRHKISKQYS